MHDHRVAGHQVLNARVLFCCTIIQRAPARGELYHVPHGKRCHSGLIGIASNSKASVIGAEFLPVGIGDDFSHL